MAIIGELIFSNANPRYSPAYSRGGDTAILTFDVLQLSSGSPSLVIDIQTKNSTDLAWSTTLAGTITLSAVGGGTLTLAAKLYELFRYRYTLTGTNLWLCLVTNPPIWQDT